MSMADRKKKRKPETNFFFALVKYKMIIVFANLYVCV